MVENIKKVSSFLIYKNSCFFRLKSNFRPKSHWEFVLKVRKANLGNFNLFQEYLYFCFIG